MSWPRAGTRSGGKATPTLSYEGELTGLAKKRLGDPDILDVMREGHIPDTPDGTSLGVPETERTQYLDLRDDGAWHKVDKANKRIKEGKGDNRRPSTVSNEEYAQRYCKTFGHRWSPLYHACTECGMTTQEWVELYGEMPHRHCGDGSR